LLSSRLGLPGVLALGSLSTGEREQSTIMTMTGDRSPRRRVALTLLLLFIAILGGLFRSRPGAHKGPQPARHTPSSVVPHPALQIADPLQPPRIQLVVTACRAGDTPVELFERVGAGGWYGGALSTRAAACVPDTQGRCNFNNLTAGPWVARQGRMTAEVWLEGGGMKPSVTVALPCDDECAVDLVVEADNACGEHGTLRFLPPAPLPDDALFEAGPKVAWSNDKTIRVDRFPCAEAVVELETPTCRQVREIPDPDGAPLRTLRLRMEPVERVTVRFVDSETGAPIQGVTMEDVDGWTVLVSNEVGEVSVIKQPRRRFMTFVLEAHHPDYQSTSVYPPVILDDRGLVSMQRREELYVVCEADHRPCPGHTQLFASFNSGPPTDPSEDVVGGGYVHGECIWDAPGTWRCERGRDFGVVINIDGRIAEFSAPDGADRLNVDMSANRSRACLRGDWPSGDCVLELRETAHPVRMSTELIPLPEGEGPVRGRVVCPEAVTWAEVVLDRGGACTTPGPWSELAGICARQKPGPAVEDVVGSGCMLLDAGAVTGDPSPYAHSSQIVLQACPSWFPPGDYFVACGENVAQPVTLVEGEVLEWVPPAP
jgi:hypothetical protein